MNAQELLAQAQDVMTVKKVFGEPHEKDGVTIIPAAAIGGGGGGGSGNSGERQGGSGSGAGFGLRARPVGAYAIKEGRVSWHPAVDVNRVILGAQVVAVIALLTIRTIVKVIAARRRR